MAKKDSASQSVSRRQFLRASVGALVPNPPPNFILILADDMGYGDLGCYGGRVPTPNIDRLAGQGVRFTNAHSVAPVCTPSRYGIMTGCYPQRSGVPGLTRVILERTDVGLPLGTSSGIYSVAELLRFAAGYFCGMVGKWHLGHLLQEFRPNAHGFEFFRGLLLSNNLSLSYYWDTQVVKQLDGNPELLTPTLLADFLEFLAQAKAQPWRPYFGVLGLMDQHLPLFPSKEFVGKSGMGLYADTILQIDSVVKQVVDAAGPNTVVLFTSDNGALVDDDLPADWQGSNYPLSGGKYLDQEGGIRIPLIANGPGISRGRVCHELVSLMDFYKTLGVLSGLLGNDPHLWQSDGQNILPLLTGSDYRVERPTLLCFNGRDIEAGIRSFEVRGRSDPGFEWRWGGKRYAFKLWAAREGSPLLSLELYNVSLDLGETKNIVGQHPEIAQAMLADMRGQISILPSETVNKDLI